MPIIKINDSGLFNSTERIPVSDGRNSGDKNYRSYDWIKRHSLIRLNDWNKENVSYNSNTKEFTIKPSKFIVYGHTCETEEITTIPPTLDKDYNLVLGVDRDIDDLSETSRTLYWEWRDASEELIKETDTMDENFGKYEVAILKWFHSPIDEEYLIIFPFSRTMKKEPNIRVYAEGNINVYEIHNLTIPAINFEDEKQLSKISVNLTIDEVLNNGNENILRFITGNIFYNITIDDSMFVISKGQNEFFFKNSNGEITAYLGRLYEEEE